MGQAYRLWSTLRRPHPFFREEDVTNARGESEPAGAGQRELTAENRPLPTAAMSQKPPSPLP